MDKKIIFLDIDGTLVTDDGWVPSSAADACRQARLNGHEIYLCTGRSKPEIYDFIMEIGFDGIIGAGGGFVELNDGMLYHKTVPASEVRRMVDFFDQHGVDFYLESNGGLFASKNFLPHVERCIYGDIANDPDARRRKEEQPHPFIEGLIYGEEDLYKTDVNKACFLQSDKLSFAQIKAEFENAFDTIQCTVPQFGDDSGELMVPGVHKATAIEALLTHLSLPKERTIAIGDGLNDLEMFDYCAVGIAMGNAKEELKAVADHITTSVDDDGLYQAFRTFGLI
ncbi:MAG: Cof-type HAD-IIB family hydrolase [Trichococcus flocculiformis]|uniref:Cof protein n=2 Tax=root TaxID=1 RepID=A0A143YFI3_9LACT|nr:Cof-type HAD-IIB family hydrolase [Trichococcus flocculiformis]MBP9977509.1 Cof-type HAD-IIB family hydrolase [Trichococcus sp.]NLD32251.1 Cof-type HAD-IIB family hydrolase [Trichococcus flocculiformis]CZQ87152.1 cof protein [Trichococcus flocculiformis]SFH64154.1 Cof subfamily of IIB subfamily of haloacid dehalogenase superfamily [Trichococcus flocculiformis]